MTLDKYRIITLFVIIFFSITNIVFAGTTGKIAGKIIDKETGEPLPGVNVVVQGTTLGSTTDIDGYYVILQVPPDMFNVVVSMVGYATLTINNVRVHIDQTTTVDIEMVQEAIEIENITVIAERKIVKKDVSSSVTSIESDQIEVLPVTSIDEIVGLQAGVEDGLVIRGGEADQLLFQIDGVTLRDPRNNKPISIVALGSIQEISIERGGFNAEYGQVRSGIINIVGKEGSINNYHGSFQIRYSPYTPKNFGISVFDPNSMWNRPYLDPEVAWAGTESGAWNTYEQRQFPRFEGWNAVSEQLLLDDDPTNDLSPAAAQKVWMWERRRRPVEAPDYTVDANLGGPIPVIGPMLGNLRFFASLRLEKEMLLIPLSRDDYRESNWALKLNSDISNDMKLMINASNSTTRNVALNADDRGFNNPAWGINGVPFWSPTDYMRSPYQIAEITNEQRSSRIFTNSWYSQAIVNHIALSAKLTDFINSTTFYEISAEHVYGKYSTGPIGKRDLTKRYEIVPGYFVDEAPFGFDINPNTGLAETGFFFGGHSSTMRDSSKLYSYLLKGDLTSQITNEHLIKAGIEFSYYDLKLDYGLVKQFFSDTNYVKEQWKPYRLSAYVQDKIEAFGFIANLGLRMDLSNPNTEWADVSPFDKAYFSSTYEESNTYPKKKAKVDIAFSPRIGISHPITENSKLYFNYGHFKQIPSYEEVFRVGRGSSGVLLNYGDPSLEQARTISYELGYDHVLFESYLIQIAAYYNDVVNQQAYTQYVSDRLGIGYYRANNNSYEDIRGLEVTLRKTDGDWIRGFASYTYQVNTQGAFGKSIINEDPVQQKSLDQNTLTLYQQKPVPQPRARASLTFFTPSDIGPELSGISPLSNWSLNIFADWKAGEYLTYNPAGLQEVINNVQLKDFFNLDLRLNKTFDFNFISLMLFVEVRNLLNSKRLSGASFYDGFDQSFYFQSLHLPQSEAYDNIPGDDNVGEYRKEGVAYQPIEIRGTINPQTQTGVAGLIYWERSSGRYMEYKEGNWADVESSRMQQILDDKAYIDMPNNSAFDFLNPRQIFFGINLSFKL